MINKDLCEQCMFYFYYRSVINNEIVGIPFCKLNGNMTESEYPLLNCKYFLKTFKFKRRW